MPIINMASAKTETEATQEMLAHSGSNLRSITSPCSKYTGKDETGNSVYETVETIIYLYDTHVGFCFEDREENGRDDSDWYMLVWNPTEKKIERHVFATTRGWSYPCYGSAPDATPEVREAAVEYLRAGYLETMKRQNVEQAKTPTFGKTVRVVKGRKIPVGTEGEVYWTGQSSFGVSRYGTWGKPKLRIGIRLLDGTRLFTDSANVEVVNPEQFEKPVADLEYTSTHYNPGTFATYARAGFAMMA